MTFNMDKIGAGRQSVKLQGGTAAAAALQLVRGHVASGEVGHRYSVETARTSRRCGNDEHGAALGGVGGEGEGEASIAYSIDTQLLECADIGQQEVLDKAAEEGIAVLGTTLDTYRICGKMAEAGIGAA